MAAAEMGVAEAEALAGLLERGESAWIGEILLSANRGEGAHTGLAVLDQVLGAALTSPEPVDWDALVLPEAESGEETGE